MKYLKFVSVFITILIVVGVLNAGNASRNKIAPIDDIFMNLDGSYFVIHNNNPCDRTYVQKLNGDYELVADCNGTR